MNAVKHLSSFEGFGPPSFTLDKAGEGDVHGTFSGHGASKSSNGSSLIELATDALKENPHTGIGLL